MSSSGSIHTPHDGEWGRRKGPAAGVRPGNESNYLYVVDVETTGLEGAPMDKVVEVGVAKIDWRRGSIDGVCNMIVNPGPLTHAERNAWIFQNSDLAPEDVAAGKPIGEAVYELQYLLRGEDVTSYYTDFDLGKFLLRRPWSLDGVIVPRGCIAKAAAKDLRHHEHLSLAKALKAYGLSQPNNAHRAVDDAIAAADLCMELRIRGVY